MRCFLFPLFFITQLWCVSLQSHTWKNKIRLPLCPADFKRSSHGLQGSRRSRLVNASSWLKQQLLIDAISQQCPGNTALLLLPGEKALLIFIKNTHRKTSRLLTGDNSQAGWAASQEHVQISAAFGNIRVWPGKLQRIKSNKWWVCAWKKKKKLERANSTVLTPAASMTRFSSFPAPLALGGTGEGNGKCCLLSANTRIFTSDNPVSFSQLSFHYDFFNLQCVSVSCKLLFAIAEVFSTSAVGS